MPAAGILDVLDNYAFVRTSGYLAGADDVYLSLSMVRKYGLRRGDAIVGQVRQPREGERKEKFNPMVRIDTVNGADPESAKNRVEFAELTPVYPVDRLRLETGPDNLIGRIMDIVAPIGKGQRGLIVSPAKAGKTMILKSIASSITSNNPECHLMVVLVDERPEEVTDFERSVKGEVISSTFDRPPADHTTVAELAIERAKRLVELGHDVVVLLDGITRLGRAYNLAAPASGRILSGGVDSAALYPPKKFFGAARNIEDGGSLTIIATALIESGSKMDEVIFEEFKGTGNMELRLRRDFAEKRIFPAIDPVQSSTRREDHLVGEEEMAITWKLRKVLAGLEGQQALELLLKRLRKTQTNHEFLTAGAADHADRGRLSQRATRDGHDGFRTFSAFSPTDRIATRYFRSGPLGEGAGNVALIVVADDDVDIRDLVEFKLATLGHQILTVADGSSAVAACRNSHPDLAVLDVMMPGLTGLEAVREIRSNPALKDIPVILLTARAQQSDVQTGYDSGADDYITKPFSPKDLASPGRGAARPRCLATAGTQALAGRACRDPRNERIASQPRLRWFRRAVATSFLSRDVSLNLREPTAAARPSRTPARLGM